MAELLQIYRVKYGREGVPLEDREYKLAIGGPCGIIQDFIWNVVKDETKIICYSHDGKYVEQTWEKIKDKWQIQSM